MPRLALRKQGADLGGQRRGHEFVGVEVQQPGSGALLLGETLLQAVAAPRLADDARAGSACHLDGAIGGP